MRRRRVPIRSQNGCRNCRERRKKCDEKHPVCSACIRLRLNCHWPLRADEFSLTQRRSPTTDPAATQASKLPEDVYLSSYDDPSILQGSATSGLHKIDDKQSLQYLCEVGATIMRYPNQLFPGYSNLNTFRLGFQMASNSPPHIHALAAIGAGHLSRSSTRYSTIALENYGHAISGLREVVTYSNLQLPSEQACAVAALLTVYQAR